MPTNYKVEYSYLSNGKRRRESDIFLMTPWTAHFIRRSDAMVSTKDIVLSSVIKKFRPLGSRWISVFSMTFNEMAT